MTLDQFENEFEKNTRLDKYMNRGICYLTIAFGLFLLLSIITNAFLDSFGRRYPQVLITSFLIIFGLYGLYNLRNRYRLTIWNNSLSKNQNLELLKFIRQSFTKLSDEKSENYLHFIYRRKWWRMHYEVHIFADNQIIAINVAWLSRGFIDFGASERTQKRILDLMKERASQQHLQFV